MSYDYPPLPVKEINLILQLYASNPDYFNNSPYPENIKSLFIHGSEARFFDSHSSSTSNGPVDVLSDEQMLQEINVLYSQLKEYGNEALISDKGSDKNTFFKVSVSLLEKMVSLREKVSNIQQVNQFVNEILNILGDVLTVDQRNEVMARLQSFDLGQNSKLTSEEN